jgi:RNA polymerase sigma-70 factor (ECF subfamily)
MMDHTPLSLLDRLRDRPEEAAWRRLVDLYEPLIGRWLAQAGVNGHDAEDLSQDILATLVREVPHFVHNGRPGAFRQWVRTIAENRCLHFWRARRNGPEPESAIDPERLVDPQSDPSRFWDAEHDLVIARRLLALIQPEFQATTWRAFHGLVVEGRRPADVATEIGVSVNAVLIAKSRVLRRLREEAAGIIEDASLPGPKNRPEA